MARFLVKASEFKNVCKAVNDRKLAELKKEIIEILKKQDENEVKKAIDYFNSQELHYTHLEKSLVSGKWIEKAGYGIGTVRIWKGKKYKKIAPGKWARVFEKEGRGTNIAIGKLIAKVQKIDNVEDLMAFVMANKQRFVDENGMDLPVLDKLRAAVDARNGNVGNKGTSKIENTTLKYDDNGKIKEVESTLIEPSKTARNFKYNKDKLSIDELKDAKNDIDSYIQKLNKEISSLEKIKKENADKLTDNAKANIDGNIAYSKNIINAYTKDKEDCEKLLEEKKNKPAEKKKTFKQEMNELYDAQDKAWEGFESGSEIKSTPENSKKFYDRVKKFVDENNIKLSKKHYDEIEEMNGHSFNEALALAGAYGEDAKKKELARNKEYSKKYKGQILDLSMIDEFKESDDENKTYWIQDPYGDRLTNEDAKNWIKENYSKIEEIKNSDVPRKDMQIRKLKYEILDLKDRLNPEDRKEIESEAEKTQNRSDAVKMTKEELKKYVMDKANEYYKNNEAALTKKANEAVEKMTAAECNKETQLTEKNSLGMFVDKFNESGKTPTDKELQELAYNVVLSRVAAAQWGDKNRKELDEQNEAEQKQKEEAINQKEKEIKEKYHGYFDSRSGLDKARDLKTLEKKYNFDGKVMSSKDFVEQAIDNGAEIKEREVNKLEYPSRTRWNRMNGYEQDEYEKRIKAAGKKTVYSINGFEFPKTVVDYAKFYKENGKSKTESEKPSKSEIAIKNKATSLAGAFGYSKTYATKMGSPFNLELAEQTVDEELDWDDGSKKALKEELRRIYSEKKVQKSLFDDFIMDVFEADEDEEIEDAIKADETEYNDYSAEQPKLFNSTSMKVREALDRIRNQVL